MYSLSFSSGRRPRPGRLLAGRRARVVVALLLVFASLVSTGVLGGAGSGALAVHVPRGHLVAVGPTSADHGFPVWYQDENGLSMGLCLDASDPLCGFLPGDIPDPTKPISFPDNFPGEAFWMLASATMPTNGGGRATLVLGLEATFATGAPIPGDQISFGRVRILVDNLQPGQTYTIIHPYGRDVFTNVDAGTRGIRYTEDIGIGAPGDFTGALKSRIGPFLTWDPPSSAPVGYLGDPALEHAVTGSPFGTNVFRIEGPSVGEPGSPFLCDPTGPAPLDCVQTALFTLQGKKATAFGVDVLAATYSRTRLDASTLDVWASSAPFQAIQASGTGYHPTALTGDGGRYFARIDVAGPPPATMMVSNPGDQPPTLKSVPVVDAVAITEAIYDLASQTLTVAGTSSDQAAPPLLTAVGFGDLVAGRLSLPNVVVPPRTVTLTSAAGGQDTRPVTVVGPGFAPIPVRAFAGVDQQVQQGQLVALDGSGSTGVITGYAWTQTAGTPVALTGADTALATFTAPSSAETLTFELRVDGVGGPSTSSVKVDVLPVAPPIADAGLDQTVPQGATVRLDGRGSTGAATYAWRQIIDPANPTPAVTLTGADTPTPSFVFPAQDTTLTFELVVSGPGGISAPDTVLVTVLPDVLTVARAEYRILTRQWIVVGTATILDANDITVHVGPTLAGAVAGTSPVDPLGDWAVRVRGSTLLPDASRTVSLESTRGGRLLAVPVVIRR